MTTCGSWSLYHFQMKLRKVQYYYISVTNHVMSVINDLLVNQSMKIIRIPINGTNERKGEQFVKLLRKASVICGFQQQFEIVGDFGNHKVSDISRHWYNALQPKKCATNGCTCSEYKPPPLNATRK